MHPDSPLCCCRYVLFWSLHYRHGDTLSLVALGFSRPGMRIKAGWLAGAMGGPFARMRCISFCFRSPKTTIEYGVLGVCSCCQARSCFLVCRCLESSESWSVVSACWGECKEGAPGKCLLLSLRWKKKLLLYLWLCSCLCPSALLKLILNYACVPCF